MTPRLRKERGIVALRLVRIGPRQVNELGTRRVEQARARQVLARRDHLVRGVRVRQVLGLVDQNYPAGHWLPFRMTRATASRSRPEWVERSAPVSTNASA